MINADMPATAQERDWQKDMEDPQAGAGGMPPTDGIGLTKREYFAAMAMQGAMASGAFNEVAGYQLTSNISHEAVEVADATLARLGET